jgi:hypothetical protein
MVASAAAGRSNSEKGEDGQDVARVARSRKGVWAMALADGAGSAPHSEIGAKRAVEKTLTLLCSEFAKIIELTPPICAKRIVDGVLRSLRLAARKNGWKMEDLATTLLFVATDRERFICGQVGDGRIAQFGANFAETVFAPSKGEFFNETVFITSSNAVEMMRIAQGRTAELRGFAIMSDGAEESLFNRQNQKFAPALERMLGWLDTHSIRKVNKAIHENLTEVLRLRTRDDVSLGLLSFGKCLEVGQVTSN